MQPLIFRYQGLKNEWNIKNWFFTFYPYYIISYPLFPLYINPILYSLFILILLYIPFIIIFIFIITNLRYLFSILGTFIIFYFFLCFWWFFKIIRDWVLGQYNHQPKLGYFHPGMGWFQSIPDIQYLFLSLGFVIDTFLGVVGLVLTIGCRRYFGFHSG